MGLGKRAWEERQSDLEVAKDILVEAGVCNRCYAHPEIVWDTLGDPEPAYRRGNFKFTNGDLDFSSRREMTDMIMEAFNEAAAVDGCPYCAKD